MQTLFRSLASVALLLLAGCGSTGPVQGGGIEKASSQLGESSRAIKGLADKGLEKNKETDEKLSDLAKDEPRALDAKASNQAQGEIFEAVKARVEEDTPKLEKSFEDAVLEKKGMLAENDKLTKKIKSQEKEISDLKAEGLRNTKRILALASAGFAVSAAVMVGVAFAFGLKSIPFAIVFVFASVGSAVALRSLDYLDYIFWAVAAVTVGFLIYLAVFARSGRDVIKTVEKLKNNGFVDQQSLKEAAKDVQGLFTKLVVDAQTTGVYRATKSNVRKLKDKIFRKRN